MRRDDLVRWLDDYLQIGEIKDYGPQGLQVEGRAEVNRIVGAVDAHLPVAQAAVNAGGDLLLVHHGILWREVRKISGSFGKLVRFYIENDLNLYGAHLPLDAHPVVGNNAELARILGLAVDGWWAKHEGIYLGTVGVSQEGEPFEQLVLRLTERIGAPLAVQHYGPARTHKVAILSGFGASDFNEAIAMGADTLVTGETSHAAFYTAQNEGVNVIYAGHYQSETVGVQALGEKLAQDFGLDFVFIDLPTGM